MRDAAGAWRKGTPVTNAGGRSGRVSGSLAVPHPCRFVYFVEWADSPGTRCAVAADNLTAQIVRLLPYVRHSPRASHPDALHKARSVSAALHRPRVQKVAHDLDDERRDGNPCARSR